MKRIRLRRPSPAFVLALLALIAALGGTAYALGRNSVGSRQVKNNSLTGLDINEAKVGPVNGVKKFRRGANEDQTVTLAQNSQFKVVGNCDANNNHAVPGFPPTSTGTWIGIVNKSQDNGLADTSDDVDNDFDVGDGVAFNFQDGGDEGEAILRNGHWIAVEGSIVFDSTQTTVFSNDCVFAGYAEFN